MEKTHLKFCYIYTNNASIAQKMRFLYINGYILETCHICMESLIIYLRRNVNNSKFIKTKFPLKFDQHTPLIVSKATLRPTRAPNKTPALAQEWAVWGKPTLDLMHVTLTARKQRVYSKLVFKTYKNALCNWLRKLSKRNVEFHCKAQCANTQ